MSCGCASAGTDTAAAGSAPHGGSAAMRLRACSACERRRVVDGYAWCTLRGSPVDRESPTFGGLCEGGLQQLRRRRRIDLLVGVEGESCEHWPGGHPST